MQSTIYDWTENYWNQINRNIGPLTFYDQEKLRKSKITVLGLGGLGSPLVENLVRAGCENLVICDNERFDPSNLNRQICTRYDLGRFKVDVVEDHAQSINPNVNVEKYYNVNKYNIGDIINQNSVVALTLDDPAASIMIARECSKKGVDMLETWGIPYLWSWWFSNESIDYETCYNLDTHHMTLEEITFSGEVYQYYRSKLLEKVFQFPGIFDTYDRETGVIKDMLNGDTPIRSFVPFIRISAAFLSVEIIFAGILGIKPKIFAPYVVGYDYIRMKQIRFEMR